MPKFSQASFSKLSTCHPDLQVIFYTVIKYFDCTILEGFRNQADQETAFAHGATQLHWPHGKHNSQPSMAVDVIPYPVDFKDTLRAYYFGGIVMGIAKMLKDEGKITHSLRWGADWNSDTLVRNESFKDSSHFELID